MFCLLNCPTRVTTIAFRGQTYISDESVLDICTQRFRVNKRAIQIKKFLKNVSGMYIIGR